MPIRNEITIDSHLNKVDAKIVLNLAKFRMNVSEVARQMYMHRNTVVYHINKIYRLTGKNPLDFYELYALTHMARRMIGGDFI